MNLDCETAKLSFPDISQMPTVLAKVDASLEGLVTQQMSGTIRRLTDKGFGFVEDENGVEYFFHHSAVRGARFDDLQEGQRVTFIVGQGPKGPRAESVSVENQR